MTYEEAKAACLNAEDELYGDDTERKPILPFCQMSQLHNRRTYVVVWNVHTDNWEDLYLHPEDSATDVIQAWKQSQAGDHMAFSSLVPDAQQSRRWQVLSIKDLAELNHRDWADIPSCRGY